jgi:hypothetical protein
MNECADNYATIPKRHWFTAKEQVAYQWMERYVSGWKNTSHSGRLPAMVAFGYQ